MEQTSFLQIPVDSCLQQDFLTWLWAQSGMRGGNFVSRKGEPFSVNLEQRIVVQGGNGELTETVSVAGDGSPLFEARQGLEKGKHVIQAFVRITQNTYEWTLTLKPGGFSVAGLKTPEVDRDAEGDDPDAVFFDKVYLVEQCFALFDVVYETFLQLRLSPQWENERAKVGQWIASI